MITKGHAKSNPGLDLVKIHRPRVLTELNRWLVLLAIAATWMKILQVQFVVSCLVGWAWINHVAQILKINAVYDFVLFDSILDSVNSITIAPAEFTDFSRNGHD